MKNPILICLTLFVTITFSGCLKKGDDDPLISLRSRKSRVEGDWKVVSLIQVRSYSDVNDPTNNYSTVFTANESTYTSVHTEDGISTTSNGTLSEEWEFDKDGSYEMSNVFDGTQTTIKGKWNFTSGVGEAKNKSHIILSLEAYSFPHWQTTLTGNQIIDAYDIQELRNKKMVLHYHHTEKDDAEFTSDEVEVELEQD